MPLSHILEKLLCRVPQPRDPGFSLSISLSTEAPGLSVSWWDGAVLIPSQGVWDSTQLWAVLSTAWAVCG